MVIRGALRILHVYDQYLRCDTVPWTEVQGPTTIDTIPKRHHRVAPGWGIAVKNEVLCLSICIVPTVSCVATVPFTLERILVTGPATVTASGISDCKVA